LKKHSLHFFKPQHYNFSILKKIIDIIKNKFKNRLAWLKTKFKILKIKGSVLLKNEKGIYEFKEFTWDMVRALPKAYYYKSKNINFSIFIKPNLESIYYFTNKAISKDIFDIDDDNKTYEFNGPDFIKKQWLPPPLKEEFKGYLKFNKPVITIQNKYSLEFSGEGVFNFFSLEFLDKFFNEFKDKYQIIYIRPKPDQKNYYQDKNEILNFKDYELIKDKHCEVKTIYDFEYLEENFNILQFKIHSSSDKHLSVSGGNACLAAYFGGELIIYDSPKGKGAGRGIWKTDSWLSKISNSKIKGFNSFDEILNYTRRKWS